MSFANNISNNQKKEVPINPIPPQAEIWQLVVQPGASDQQWQSVAYGNGIFVAVSTGGTSGTQTMYSPDGKNWTNGGNFPNPGIILIPRSVIFGNGVFVASCSAGSVARLAWSVDGKVWNLSNISSLQSWQCVCFGNGQFVALSTSGAAVGTRAATSYDGVNWTVRNTPTPAGDLVWEGITYGNGLYVGVASNGADRVMTSPDGITWTVRDTGGGDAIAWREVCYGNGTFVAVGTPDAANNAVMTSPDGIVWTLRTVQVVAGGGGTWFGVVYANGTFVAVGSGSSNSIMKSVNNGIVWTEVTTDPQTNQSFLSVAYGNGIFVAVANTGTERIMVSGQTYNNSEVYQNSQLTNMWRFVRFVAPGGGKVINAGGKIAQFFNEVGNVGGAETDLFVYDIPANLLSAAGQSVFGKFSGYTTATVATRIRAYIGATQIMDETFTTDGDAYCFDLEVIRDADGAQTGKAFSELRVAAAPGSIPVVIPGITWLAGIDWTVVQQFRLTAETANNDEVTAEMGTIYFAPEAI